MADTFTCQACGGTFEKGHSDEEALAELREEHPGVPVEETAVVCGDCWQKLKIIFRN